MLRFARQHFEALRPYRWRLQRMERMVRPTHSAEHRTIVAAIDALDRAARMHLEPDEYAAWLEPWMPEDHA